MNRIECKSQEEVMHADDSEPEGLRPPYRIIFMPTFGNNSKHGANGSSPINEHNNSKCVDESLIGNDSMRTKPSKRKMQKAELRNQWRIWFHFIQVLFKLKFHYEIEFILNAYRYAAHVAVSPWTLVIGPILRTSLILSGLTLSSALRRRFTIWSAAWFWSILKWQS